MNQVNHSTDPDAITQQLIVILSEEFNEFTNMLSLLEGERSALETQNIEKVNHYTREKKISTDLLENCASKRNQLMESLNQSIQHRKTIPAVLDKLWLQIIEKAKLCKQSNQINGKIIQISQSSIQRSMRLLKSSSRDLGMTYGSRGEALAQTNSLSELKA